MTVLSLTALHAKPEARWDDLQSTIKTANDLVRKHGGENVGALVGMAAGPASGTLTVISTSPDWASYGKTMDALLADPEMQAIMDVSSGPVAGWDTYVLQSIPDL